MVNYSYIELMALVDHLQQLFSNSCKQADDFRSKNDAKSIIGLAQQIGYITACNDFMMALNAQIDALASKERVLQ